MKYLLAIFFSIGVFCLSTIFVPAQQNTKPLEETVWQATAPVSYATYYSKATALYYLGKQNKAKVVISFLDAPPSQMTFDAVTGQWKTQYYSPEIRNVSDENGTYKKTGNFIRIEFPDHLIAANIKNSRMTGEVIDKKTEKKIGWSAEKTTVENYTADASNKIIETKSGDSNSSSSGVTKTTSKGIDIEVITKSYESDIPDAVKNQDKLESPRKLKTDSYKIEAVESITSSFGTFKNNITFYIQIESINANGNVKALLRKSGGEGQLKGKVDERGNLDLEGTYNDGLNNEWSIKLNATFQNDTLTNGKYHGVSKNNVKFNGNF